MLSKPDACRGCPFYQDGQGFVPDEVREGTEVFVLGQNPGAMEEQNGRPFVGDTGKTMEKDFLPLAGLTRSDISIGNTYRCRWQRSNELPDLASKLARDVAEHCTRAHLHIPASTRLIVAQGAYALWAATGEGLAKDRTITSWRGYLLPFRPVPMPVYTLSHVWTPGPGELPVLPTLHIASLFKGQGEGKADKRGPALKVPMKYDWAKVPLILKGAWPQPLPDIATTPPTLDPGVWSFDTEFEPENPTELTRYSVARLTAQGPEVWVVEGSVPLRRRGRAPAVVMHNAPADLGHLASLLGFDSVFELLDAGVQLEDTMYEHSVLWSDLDHDLNFVGSMYARINRWKHLVQINPQEYSAGDALGTIDGHYGLQRELSRDPDSGRVYEEIVRPLIPIIYFAESHGLDVDQDRAREYMAQLEAQREDAETMAQAAVGWPINLSSQPQVSHELYVIEQIKKRGPGVPTR